MMRKPLAMFRVEAESAFLLHSYTHRETSLVLDVFSRHHGRVSLIAKGAKRPYSELRAVLLTFEPLLLSWTGRNDVKVLSRAGWAGQPQALSGSAALCGYYLNELLMRLLARGDPHEVLFDYYTAILRLLSSTQQNNKHLISAAPQETGRHASLLRLFEWKLIQAIGYGFEVRCDARGESIAAQTHYCLHPEQGVMPINANASRSTLAGKRLSGQALQMLAAFDEWRMPVSDPATVTTLLQPLDQQTELARELRHLLRDILFEHLSGRPLHTRQVWSALLATGTAPGMPAAASPAALDPTVVEST